MGRELIFEKLVSLIKAYGPSRLAKESGISRQGIYRFLTERNPRYETLEKITSVLHIDFDLARELPTTDDVYSSLKFYGAPISTNPTDIPLPLEESLAHGIVHSRTDGFISSIIPYLLFKKADELNTSHLIALCDVLGESRTLGYYADMANSFRPNKKLARLVDLLSDLHFEQEQLFKNTKKTESLKILAKTVNNPIAKKWKFLTIDSLDHHLERYKKWLNQE